VGSLLGFIVGFQEGFLKKAGVFWGCAQLHQPCNKGTHMY